MLASVPGHQPRKTALQKVSWRRRNLRKLYFTRISELFRARKAQAQTCYGGPRFIPYRQGEVADIEDALRLVKSTSPDWE